MADKRVAGQPTSRQVRIEERRQRRAGARRQEKSASRRRRTIAIAGAVIGAIAVAAVAVYFVARTSALPAGTQSFAETNHDHVTGAVQYDHGPPAGGAHNAVWLNCGVYDQPVPNENAVHSLEHGAVWITYQPDALSGEVAMLRQLVESHYHGSQRYLLLSPYPGLPAPIVASAWGAQLQLSSAQDPRLLAFIQHFSGGGQGGEPGAPCTNGTGSPVG